MRFFAVTALGLASLSLSAPAPVAGRGISLDVELELGGVGQGASSPLDVKLELHDNSKVKALVTNKADRSLRVLRVGTLLDSSPVEKVLVSSKDGEVPFGGVKFRLLEDSLTNDDFAPIPAGESISAIFDIAEHYDLSSGGSFNITCYGALSYAEADSNLLTGSAPYSSNIIEASIDGLLAAAVRVSFLDKRVRNKDCKGDRLRVQEEALSNCESMARAASDVAFSGSSSKMVEYFKSSSISTRYTVSRTFDRVTEECSSMTSGVSDYYCSDPYGFCTRNILAYTLASESYTAYCDLYFDALPQVASQCHGQDKGGTTIHEMTHLRQIKGTSDYGGYGYSHVRSLSARQNLNHADTYALFAQAVHYGC